MRCLGFLFFLINAEICCLAGSFNVFGTNMQVTFELNINKYLDQTAIIRLFTWLICDKSHEL